MRIVLHGSFSTRFTIWRSRPTGGIQNRCRAYTDGGLRGERDRHHGRGMRGAVTDEPGAAKDRAGAGPERRATRIRHRAA